MKSARTAECAPRPRRAAAAELAGLVVVQCALLWRFWDALDFEPYDEVAYFHRGIGMFDGHAWAWQLAWGPLYSACYGVLGALPLGGICPLDAMYALVALGSTLALWWALRALLPSPLAFLLVVWWAASGALTSSDRTWWLNPEPRTMVNAFGMLLWCLAIGLFARRRRMLALLPCALLFLTRPETGATSVLAGVLLLAAGLARRRTELARSGAVWLAFGVLLVAVASSNENLRERVWFNFGQTFVANIGSRGEGELPRAIDVLQAEPYLRRSFPTAESIPAAARENPREFLAHVALNLRSLPRAFRPSLASSFAQAPWLRCGALALAALFCLAGCLRATPWSAFARCPTEVWLFLCASLSIVPSLLIMNVQDRFVLPLVPGIYALVGCAMFAGWQRLGLAPRLSKLTPYLPVAVPVAVLLLPPLFPPARAPLVHRASTRLVREVVRDEPLSFFATHGSSYAVLASTTRLRATGLTELGSDEALRGRPFADVVAARPLDVVLVTPLWKSIDDVYPGTLAELESPRWRRIEIAPGWTFFARATLDPLPLDLARLAQLRARGGSLADLTAPTLTAELSSVSVAAGGSVQFLIDAGPRCAGLPYVVFGAFEETPIGSPQEDAYFQAILREGDRLIEGWRGRLDGEGRARARLQIPADTARDLIGRRVKHAFAVLGPGGQPIARSEPVTLELTE